jgi:hypothetical protein
MQFAENVQANWQEEYCFIKTMPDPTQPEQPRREFRNYSGNFLNIRPAAPSDFHLFGLLKNRLGGKRFADDEKAQTEVRKWLRQQSKHSMLRVSSHW